MATVTASRTDTRSDEEIQRDVLAELRSDPRLQPNEIGVIVKDGVATLTGWVDSYTRRWAAEGAAATASAMAAMTEGRGKT